MENKKQQQNNFTGSRACQPSESSVRKSASDLQVNKPWPRNSRRREQPSATRNESQRNSKQYPTVKARSNVDKRPRQRGGGGSNGGNNFGNSDATGFEEDGIACALDDVSASGAGLATLVEPVVTGALTKKKFRQHIDYEQNSVYAPGSKKQSLNHLLNFHYASRDAGNAFRFNVFGRNGGSGKTGATKRYGANGGASKRQRYNKEQFLQANFQFVVKSGVHLSMYASPDTLIDWHLIDQINIQTEEEPQCPICLYPPIAAKLTRCGHAYCWPCILHYLALSDKSWRKCPICFEAIHIADLKSTTIVQQRQFNLDDEITFQLMRRKKGCMIIEKYKPNNLNNTTDDKYPLLSASDECKRFSKFLIAKRNDILKIIEREHNELIAGQDPNSPEYVFIQQALDLLKERREKIEEMPADEDEDDAGFKTDESEHLHYDHENMQLKQELESVTEDFENEEALHEVHDLDAEISTESGIQSIEDSSIYSTSNLIAVNERDNTKYYYFYQSLDGQNIYLHPLNVKMLQACYGTLDRAPLIISARVLQKEYHSMDEEHRRKFTCLGHLPLTCQFAVIEVDLQPPFVTDEILRLFKDDIQMRKKERQRREREEQRREKKINEINDRQMGKLIASTANLNLTSAQEFPTWGFEEALPSVGIDVSINSSKPTAIPKSKRQATYSTVAVVGESPKAEEYWPTLTSPTGNNSNMYQELSSWGRNVSTPKLVTINSTNRMANSDRSSECESIDDSLADITPMRTDLGDVLAMAMSQKKQKSTLTSAGQAVSGKKNKKAKKLVPLFSTGINYNGK